MLDVVVRDETRLALRRPALVHRAVAAHQIGQARAAAPHHGHERRLGRIAARHHQRYASRTAALTTGSFRTGRTDPVTSPLGASLRAGLRSAQQERPRLVCARTQGPAGCPTIALANT